MWIPKHKKKTQSDWIWSPIFVNPKLQKESSMQHEEYTCTFYFDAARRRRGNGNNEDWNRVCGGRGVRWVCSFSQTRIFLSSILKMKGIVIVYSYKRPKNKLFWPLMGFQFGPWWFRVSEKYQSRRNNSTAAGERRNRRSWLNSLKYWSAHFGNLVRGSVHLPESYTVKIQLSQRKKQEEEVSNQMVMKPRKMNCWAVKTQFPNL